jgi:hypothetical protein
MKNSNKIGEKNKNKNKKRMVVSIVGALLSGSMSGFSAHTLKRKSHLVWPKTEEKQDTDDFTCQVSCDGLLRGWSHDQLPKMEKKNQSYSPGL